MALHENDYDVAKTVNFFLEGGDLSQDWKTVGLKKKQISPNQTAEEADLQVNGQNQPNGSRKKNGKWSVFIFLNKN